jgi:hypothetical protein
MTATARTTTALSMTGLCVAREISGVIAADNSTLTDANIDPDAAINCAGFETIWAGVEVTGGSSPTVTLEPLFYDPSAADGSRWWRSYVGAASGITAIAAPVAQVTPALGAGQMVELRVDGHPQVYLRRTAVANSGSTTAMRILVRPGKQLPRVLR